MKLNNTVVTLALLGALALAALAGGLLPAWNAVYAQAVNAAPIFDTGGGTRPVDENTPPGVNIGAPISATDADEGTVEYGDALTYSLEGTDAASFDIDPSTGQLITKAPLNADTDTGGQTSYSVTVRVEDGRGGSATQDVRITVEEVNEPPAAPAAPTVVSGAADASTTSLKVIWHEPENTGDTLGNYEVQYKKTTGLAFFSGDNPNTPDATEVVTITGTTATITELEADTFYHVRVRATSPESQSDGVEIAPWSLVGTGSTNKEGNSPPGFGADAITRSVFENTSAGEDVGAPVTANDADAATLTYRLDGPDADLFGLRHVVGSDTDKGPSEP